MTRIRLWALGWLLIAFPAMSADAVVAVAANFASTGKQLVGQYAASTGHDIDIVIGSTGLLYAQIVRGAPYDLFLAADRSRPERLIEQGAATRESQYIFAEGRLALWVPAASTAPELSSLARQFPGPIAQANPNVAPYGAAAKALIVDYAAGVDEEVGRALTSRIVYGESVTSVFTLVDTGNAVAGFVALSQLLAQDVPREQYRVMSVSGYPPIEQMAVLTQRGAVNGVARSLMTYLQSPAAIEVIKSSGYRVPEASESRPDDRLGVAP